MTGLRVTVKDFGHAMSVLDPNYIAPDSVLLNVCDVVDGCTLRIVNPATGADVVVGRDIENPAVDTVTRSVYFYAERDKRGVTLFVAPLADLTRRTRVAHLKQDNSRRPPRPIDIQRAPVVLPRGRGAVFIGAGDSLTLHDAAAQSATALPYVHCTPVLIRAVSGELLCMDARFGGWYLRSLDTGERTIVSSATRAGSAVYDAHSDALVVSVSALALTERSDVYRVPLGDRLPKQQIARGIYFSAGIWVPDRPLGSPPR